MNKVKAAAEAYVNARVVADRKRKNSGYTSYYNSEEKKAVEQTKVALDAAIEEAIANAN